LFWDEGESVDGETALRFWQGGGSGTGGEVIDRCGGGEPPGEAGKRGCPGEGFGIAEAIVERLPDFFLAACAADAPGFEVVAVAAVIAIGELDEVR
jgi:hypothetical protein